MVSTYRPFTERNFYDQTPNSTHSLVLSLTLIKYIKALRSPTLHQKVFSAIFQFVITLFKMPTRESHSPPTCFSPTFLISHSMAPWVWAEKPMVSQSKLNPVVCCLQYWEQTARPGCPALLTHCASKLGSSEGLCPASLNLQWTPPTGPLGIFIISSFTVHSFPHSTSPTQKGFLPPPLFLFFAFRGVLFLSHLISTPIWWT